MQEITLRGQDFESMAEVYDFLKNELDISGRKLKSLSALYDALTELTDDTKIELDLTAVEDDGMLESLERMAEILTDAADENECLEVSVSL